MRTLAFLTPPTLAEVTDGLPEHFSSEFDRGFRTADQIAQDLLESYVEMGCNPAVLRPAIEHCKQEAVNARRELQNRWPSVTDCDRLDRAFAQLNASGILARHDFGGAGFTGKGNILEQLASAGQAGLPVRGCVWYTADDTESAATDGKLCLNYLAAEAQDEASELIGLEVIDTLDHNELAAEWIWSIEQQICVRLSWQRRVPGI